MKYSWQSNEIWANFLSLSKFYRKVYNSAFLEHYLNELPRTRIDTMLSTRELREKYCLTQKFSKWFFGSISNLPIGDFSFFLTKPCKIRHGLRSPLCSRNEKVTKVSAGPKFSHFPTETYLVIVKYQKFPKSIERNWGFWIIFDLADFLHIFYIYYIGGAVKMMLLGWISEKLYFWIQTISIPFLFDTFM